ncbi:MAG TPA: hypothetical protein VF137_00905 [Candidatus Dormibacteraeota bacterium]
MSRRSTKLAWGCAVVLLGATLLRPPAGGPVAAYSSSVPTFGTPVVSGVQGQGYEQSLRIDGSGRLYTSVPGSWPSGITWLWRSNDRGKTFKWVPAAAPLTGRTLEGGCGGGGDSELAVDSAGNLYLADLSTYNFATARTSDGGATFTPPNCLSVSTSPDDRPWFATDGNPMAGGSLYMTYDQVAQGTPVCPGGTTTSPDGPNNQLVIVRSPVGGQPGATAGLVFGPAQSVGTGCDEGVMGNLVVSPTTHNVFVVHDDTTYSQILVGRCTPVDWTIDPTGMQCSDHPVTYMPGQIIGANFPTIAVDSSGQLFAVWEAAPCSPCFNSNTTAAAVDGDTLLYFSRSADDGLTWTPAAVVPTPGLHNNVYAWVGAGDQGKFDIAWYGTAATETPGQTRGPDSVQGDWSVYMIQSLDGGQTFTAPILASEHFVHRGALNTLLGGQSSANTGGRALGDFLELRIGLAGEANITYGDSDLDGNTVLSQGMFVRQNGGPGVLGNRPLVRGGHKPVDGVTDVACDGTLDAAGLSSASFPNLDLLSSSVSQPDPAHYRVQMQVQSLASLAPDPADGGPDLVWLTQWHVPSTSDPQGGKVFFAYMESFNGQAPTFWDGESALYLANGGTGQISYPGLHQVAGSYTAGSPATITITVPAADVSDSAIDQNLYSVQASTMTLTAQASSVPPTGGIGGLPFNLIDTTTAFDYVPGLAPSPVTASTACGVPPPVVSTLTCPSLSPAPTVLTNAFGTPLVPPSRLAPWIANGDDCDDIDGAAG